LFPSIEALSDAMTIPSFIFTETMIVTGWASSLFADQQDTFDVSG
jgi:hypothetical protein